MLEAPKNLCHSLTSMPGLRDGMIFVLGVLAGILAFFIYGWIEHTKERRYIRRGLILEILYFNRSQMFLELDRYQTSWPDGPYNPDISRAKYVTAIFDVYFPRLISTLGDPTWLQVSYYYHLVKLLNWMKEQERNEIDDGFVRVYLHRTAHAYAMMIGALDALSGKRVAELEESIGVLLTEASDRREHDKKTLKHYGIKIEK